MKGILRSPKITNYCWIFFFWLTVLWKQNNDIIPNSCEHAAKWKLFSAVLKVAIYHGAFNCMPGGEWQARRQIGIKGKWQQKGNLRFCCLFFFFFSFLTWLRGLPPSCSVLTAAALTASFLSLSLTPSPHHFASTSGQHPFTYWTDTMIHILPFGTFPSVTHRSCHSLLSLACCWQYGHSVGWGTGYSVSFLFPSTEVTWMFTLLHFVLCFPASSNI